MKIERAWLRIIVSVIVGGVTGIALYMGLDFAMSRGVIVVARSWFAMIVLSLFLTGPIVATVLAHALTPREKKDGHTRCGKCGYILKGLTEPRCSECGERI